MFMLYKTKTHTKKKKKNLLPLELETREEEKHPKKKTRESTKRERDLITSVVAACSSTCETPLAVCDLSPEHNKRLASTMH